MFKHRSGRLMLGGLCVLGAFAVATMWLGRAESQSSKSPYRSPLCVALSPDGKKLYIAHYYTGAITVMDTESNKPVNHIAVGAQPPADAVRKGEEIFNDATRAFQHWHSCTSCHTDGRVDGLRWDFLNDGIGNAKDTLSLLNFDKMPLMNRRTTGNNPRECVKGGLTSTHMGSPTEEMWTTCLPSSSRSSPNPARILSTANCLPPRSAARKFLRAKASARVATSRRCSATQRCTTPVF